MAAGWTKIPPVQAPEEDGGGFLGGLLAIGLPIAGAIAGFALGGPPGAGAAISGLTAGQGAMIGAGIGHAAGGVARAALTDSPARQDQLIQQGLAAGFATLPYLAKAYDTHAAAQLPGGPIQPMPISSGPPAGSMSLTGPAEPSVTSQYYAPGTLGAGSEAISAYPQQGMGASNQTGVPSLAAPLPTYGGLSPQAQDMLNQPYYAGTGAILGQPYYAGTGKQFYPG